MIPQCIVDIYICAGVPDQFSKNPFLFLRKSYFIRCFRGEPAEMVTDIADGIKQGPGPAHVPDELFAHSHINPTRFSMT
jgi:hypothetical protein